MNESFVKNQLKISKKQSNDERYEYLQSQFNATEYCIKLEKYTIKLEKELKKKNDELNCTKLLADIQVEQLLQILEDKEADINVGEVE